MPADPARLADRLLDAQVAFVLDELTGPDGAASVADEVRGLVTSLWDVPLRSVLEPASVRETVHAAVAAAGDAEAVGTLTTVLTPQLRDLDAHADHRLGEVVPWGGVEATVDVLVRSAELREELLRRLQSSPAVSTLALRFVQALVGDAVQQNRERAERLPGMKSVLGMGDLAARTARGMTPRQLNDAVGGVADRGAQAAMERVSRAFVDAFDEDVVREAVMEVWDLHADEDVAALRAYLAPEHVEELAAVGHAVWLDVHATPWFAAVVDAAVDAFYATFGDEPVGVVLEAHGIGTELLDATIERHAFEVVAALDASGRLEAVVRRRLAPFFTAPSTVALLAEG